MRTRDAFLELISPALARSGRDRRILVALPDMRRQPRPEAVAAAGVERRLR